jgi:hypothetical protein
MYEVNNYKRLAFQYLFFSCFSIVDFRLLKDLKIPILSFLCSLKLNPFFWPFLYKFIIQSFTYFNYKK